MPSDRVSGDFREANGVLRSPSLNESTFLAALMPKKEIGADRFIEAHPEYDGRGVVIAIFGTEDGELFLSKRDLVSILIISGNNSGVDPASAGLQITSDGKPKILDILDCTGSGDIDTSKVVKADMDGCIIGASGAKLVLNQSWKNPSGEWHVGSKLVYELFTDSLTSRIKNERKKKWEEKNQEAFSNALKQLNEFDQKHTKTEDAKLKRIREDLQHKVDLLRKLFDSYDDKGPVIDAVVWNDGDVWRVALDTQNLDDDPEAGKLSNFIPMTNFRTERRHGIFGKLDACSFVTNIYDDGNILSIVTDSSPHGTHVAGIAAAFHPQEPLLNGVAPGAQLISCKIGDSRLGSMETGTGLTRALIAAVEELMQLSCFSQPDGGILGNSSFTSLVLVPGEIEAFYVGPPAKSKLPKCCSTGSILVGEITYGNLSFDKGTASQKCPVCYPIFYMVPPLKIDEKDADTDKFDSKKSISDLIDEQVRNAKLKVLSGLKQGNKEEVSKWKELSDSLKMEYPKFTPLLVKILENLLCREDTHDKTSYYSEIINACNDVIESIDRDELAKYFLEKSDPEDEEGMSLKKKMETSRDQLAEALYRKGLALVDNESLLKTGRKSPTIEDLDQTLDGSSHGDLFEENFKELRRWVDVKAPKYALLTVFREKRGGRLGTSLKVLDDIIQDGSELSKKLYDLKIDLLDELGWAHVAAYERGWMFIRFPPALPVF